MESFRGAVMKTVVIAGATGYLGAYLVAFYHQKGWHVRALVRNEQTARAKGLEASEFFEGEATKPDSLSGLMEGADLVISALGITRQKDGLTYKDVDFQANKNLLELAIQSSVPQFAYIHVLNAAKMLDVELVRAKQDFVDVLQAAPIKSTVISPSGYFSDLEEFLGMAKSGRVYLFGSGACRLNPIHGADLAEACYGIIEDGKSKADVGGPVTYTQNEIAELALQRLGKKNQNYASAGLDQSCCTAAFRGLHRSENLWPNPVFPQRDAHGYDWRALRYQATGRPLCRGCSA